MKKQKPIMIELKAKDIEGADLMCWPVLLDKKEPLWALFDNNSKPSIRALSWTYAELEKIRKRWKWGAICKIKPVQIDWKEI